MKKECPFDQTHIQVPTCFTRTLKIELAVLLSILLAYNQKKSNSETPITYSVRFQTAVETWTRMSPATQKRRLHMLQELRFISVRNTPILRVIVHQQGIRGKFPEYPQDSDAHIRLYIHICQHATLYASLIYGLLERHFDRLQVPYVIWLPISQKEISELDVSSSAKIQAGLAILCRMRVIQIHFANQQKMVRFLHR